MFVSEWMTANPQTVSSKTPVMEAMQLLRKGGYRRLPVVDSVPEGSKGGGKGSGKGGYKLVGIVTDRDLKEATPSKATTLSVYELNYLLSKLSVRDVMVSPVVTVSPEEPVENAALLMEEHKVSGLPVVSGGTLQGIFTITDMLRAIVAMLGLREGGTRVTVNLPDEPGALAQAASAAAPSNIIAVVTAGVHATAQAGAQAIAQEGQRRELVLRVTGEGAEGFPERLRAGGLDVTDSRSDGR